MENITNTILTPAIIVALISVIIQGLKALIDVIVQIKNRKNTILQNNLTYLTILNSFIDSSPLDEGQKIQAKLDNLKKFSPNQLPEGINILLN